MKKQNKYSYELCLRILDNGYSYKEFVVNSPSGEEFCICCKESTAKKIVKAFNETL